MVCGEEACDEIIETGTNTGPWLKGLSSAQLSCAMASQSNMRHRPTWVFFPAPLALPSKGRGGRGKPHAGDVAIEATACGSVLYPTTAPLDAPSDCICVDGTFVGAGEWSPAALKIWF